jgi:hypothetical protein
LRHAYRSVPKALLVALAILAPRQGIADEPQKEIPIPIAVIDFDYRDTSGETRDGTTEHRMRLETFMSAIRSDLASSGKYRVVSISCGVEPCAIESTTPSELFDKAKRAGARLMLYGGVHKMSTLVQWAKVQVVDVEADRLVADRLLSFRGDTDEAWRRAETFIVDKLKNDLLSK